MSKKSLQSALLLITNLPGGGAEKMAATVANGLSKFHSSKLVTINEGKTTFKLNVEHMCLGLKRYRHIPEGIAYIWKGPVAVWRYTRLLRIEKPDVSFSFLDIDNLINIISCRITGVTAVISLRENPVCHYSSRLLRCVTYFVRFLTFSLLKKWSALIITNSFGAKNALLELYPLNQEDIEVIYNPKDIETIYQLSLLDVHESFFETDDAIITYVGNLYLEKGVWHLIRIFREIHKTHRCKLLFCGKGGMKDDLEDFVNTYNLSEDVLFLGWTDNPYKYVSKSTVFAFPSTSEGQPNALIEALICGCPVVSADCEYGPEEILDGCKYGLLSKRLDGYKHKPNVPLTEAEYDMMDKIVYLLDNPDIRQYYSNMGKSRGLEFAQDKLIREFEIALEKTIER